MYGPNTLENSLAPSLTLRVPTLLSVSILHGAEGGGGESHRPCPFPFMHPLVHHESDFDVHRPVKIKPTRSILTKNAGSSPQQLMTPFMLR